MPTWVSRVRNLIHRCPVEMNKIVIPGNFHTEEISIADFGLARCVEMIRYRLMLGHAEGENSIVSLTGEVSCTSIPGSEGVRR